MKRLIIICLLFVPWVTYGQSTWTLQQCINYAVENNIQVNQSELNVEMANQQLIQARASALPTLNGFGSHGYNWGQRIDPFTNLFATSRVRTNSLGLSSSITLFNGLQTLNNMKQSKFDLLAGRYDVEKMKNDIAMNLATNYLQILFNEELKDIAEKQVQVTRLQLQRLESLEAQGQIALGRVLDMRAQLANDEVNLVNAQNQVDLSYLSLVQLMQLDASAAANFKIAKPDLSAIDPVELQNTPGQVFDQASRVMPEVKSAETSLQSAEAGLSSAKGLRYPRLTLTGSYGSGYSGLSMIPTGNPTLSDPILIGFTGSNESVFTQQPVYEFVTKPFSDQIRDNINQSLSFSLSVPIFNGWSTSANVKRARIAYENARYNLKNTQNTLERNIRQAFADGQAAYKRYMASENAVKAMRESFKFAEVQYNQNMITNVEYRDASNKLYSAESDAIRSKYDYIFRVKIIDFYQGKSLSF